jgi:hypothetical protein
MITAPSVKESEKAISSEKYLLGSGCDRMGFRIPGSRWVYKMEKPHASGRANRREYEAYTKLMDIPELLGNVHLPEMHLLENGIIAAEYIEGVKPKGIDPFVDPIVDAFCQYTSLWDAAARCNIRVVIDEAGTKKIYIIDLAD